ncbi:MAG: 2,3-bisphosphoglycerate-independent phosphoglycerate mutase, partial [Clostridiales bacterium]|nr:2,3-bisphosphoglycerate-independent phosphoglycerate mutase [Clostridiales bacterium]
GRTVYQSLTRITKSIEDGDFFQNPALVGAMERAKGGAHALHLMGLVSPGGVHSHTDHLLALVKMAKDAGVTQIYIHAFLDGRDTPPESARGFLADLQNGLAAIGAGKIVSIAGRYYAMDRDNRWDRVELAYDTLTQGKGLRAADADAAIAASYERGEFDEFVKPTAVCGAGDEPVVVRDGDAVIFFNFRPDRARELARAFTEPSFDGFARAVFLPDLYFATMTQYDDTLSHVHVAFPPEEIKNTFGAYLSSMGLKQLRIAETEKYAHVTFFFNGQIEESYPGEDRVLIPSPKDVATYDLKPEMSAYEVAAEAAKRIRSGAYDVVILNFANCDMVGHTGVMEAAVRAVEAVDACVGEVTEAIREVHGQLLITADHGNAEEMIAPDGTPFTAHTTNDVPLILIREDDTGYALADGGALSDIAPTLLDMMGLPQPPEMTGHSLLR